MRLLIVVDKLLTGFDAPPATYLYIDKAMRDHGLFQAICRINRLDGDDKEYGYVIDYKDLFKSLQGAVDDYTCDALDGYDAGDVAGLLADRLDKAKERLEASRETIKALCEAVPEPHSQSDYLHYFCAADTTDVPAMAANAAKRAALYKDTGALLRSYANLANEMQEAGYSDSEIQSIKAEVDHFSKMRDEVALTAADYLDMKVYEPAMRHLMDTYIRAEDSETIANFEEMGLIELIVKNGLGALNKLPSGIKSKEKLVAEAIDNNLRKVIIDENPTNPKYYQKMSLLLDSLIDERRKGVIEYKEYLAKIKLLSEKVLDPGKDSSGNYPKTIKSLAQKAVFDALDSNEELAIKLDQAVLTTKKAGWIGNRMKEKEIAMAIREVVGDAVYKTKIDDLMELLRNQNEYK
jgi:type I restriction enzyme R subunit